MYIYTDQYVCVHVYVWLYSYSYVCMYVCMYRYKSRRQTKINDKAIAFLVNAAKGLLRAISLGTRRWGSSVSQDMLAFLSVWFKHGHIPEVYVTLDAGLSTVHVDNWLGVLPQVGDHDDYENTYMHTYR